MTSVLMRHLASMAKLGTIGFGGGSALIPLFERELVQERGVLTEEEFTRDTVVANVTPGGLPTKLAGLSGLRIAGVRGSVLAGFATNLPGVLIGIGLVALFGILGDSGVLAVEFAAVGISAYVVVVLLQYVFRLVSTATRRLGAALITVVIALATGTNDIIRLIGLALGQRWETHLPQLGSVAVVVIALVAIILYSLLTGWRRRFAEPRLTRPGPDKKKPPDVAAPPDEAMPPDAATPADGGEPLVRSALVTAAILAALSVAGLAAAWALAGMPGLVFMSLIALSMAATFGGGNAYIAVGAGFFVTSGMVTAEVFYGQLVPVANATPGPLISKLAAQMGWVLGMDHHGIVVAVGLALCALVQGVAVSNLIAMLVFAGYERYADAPILRDLALYILPVIGGMLVTTAANMTVTATGFGGLAGVPALPMVWAIVVLAFAIWWAQRRLRIHDVVIILLAGALTLAALWGFSTL